MAETPAILEILDLSEKRLKKLGKPSSEESLVTTLILDDNDLQRLEGIDSYSRVQKLSAVRNQLLRMYGVGRLHNLHTLNLSHNGILTIEGLKDLVLLKYLNLAGNSIKTIEHLNTNSNLEHLDLSENAIMHITDLSYLKALKDLQLHNNKITHLRQCDRYLPSSLTNLTLASNQISDLNEIGQLTHLVNLNSISIVNNPCVNMTGQKVGYDYRPFVINWCLSLQVIDGYVVDAIESLRGEWLYSQGRGRHFRIGDQQDLAQYLASVCPLSGEQQLETEDDRKLRLILSKAQHHQQQLREQGNSPAPSPSLRKKLQSAKNSPRLEIRVKQNSSRSPDKMTNSCFNSMSLTHSAMADSGIMSQSLDPSILNQQTTCESLKLSSTTSMSDKENGICLDGYEVVNSPLQALSKLVPVPESLMSPDYRPSAISSRLNSSSTIPTPTASQKPTPRFAQAMVKSPRMPRSNIAKPKVTSLEVKRAHSPNLAPPRKFAGINAHKINGNPSLQQKPLLSAFKKSLSSDDESDMCNVKLQPIQQKAVEKRLQKDTELSSCATSSSNGGGSGNGYEEREEIAAVFIQKMWRGFYARHRDKQTQDKFKSLQAQRANEYLQKLTSDMESTKAALESERKIQILQMQAINALWKKVSALQLDDSNRSIASSGLSGPQASSINTQINNDFSAQLDANDIVSTLAVTCTTLQNQVQQLQGSMQDIVKIMSMFAQITPGGNYQENGIATQTEIVAVHTPQGDSGKAFPFQKQLRPSSLPLPVGTRTPKRDANAPVEKNTSSSTSGSTVEAEVRQFAGTLVEGVIKTVSASQEDSINLQEGTDILLADTNTKLT